ncbi:outer membrane protein assembly factor BamE [Paracoccus sp. S-4012]|uniref:outer membrane protein assembly factor BamE n=1 Tax=Paracoccus sp. S-4012 TaxID=2665648 RepID=UPI0012AF792B|nr:outer membrane protein assembly factor BamE [Paracoccus sp. S-4012]MRX50302.1 outer membrane protein assembly factor BamE [Paracoccus sp. S-4012]
MLHPRRLLRPVLALTLAAALAACVPVYRNHGYLPDAESLSLVQVGQTSRDELPSLIGQPSAEGLLTGSAWFYVKSRFEHYGPRRPEEIDRDIIAVSFAEDGRVSNVEHFGLERGRVVVLSRRVTDPGVTAGGALRQILGNFGRFRADQFFDG